MNRQTDILIIGGGFGGVAAAQKLEQAGIKTLLVDTKNYFEVAFSTLRDLAAPELTQEKARKKYQDFLHGDFIQSKVVQLTQSTAQLVSGEVIKFNKVIIATGSRYPSFPVAKTLTATDYQARNAELKQAHEKLKLANSVLIIGGGIVGVELAGEIADAFPDKTVTLAHKGSRVLDSLTPKASQKATEQLIKLGVKLEFNRLYHQDGNNYIDQNSSEVAMADLVYESIGAIPNSEIIQTSFADALNDRGYIKVDADLKVSGYDNLYAMGDVAEVGEGKLGYLAVKQGEYLAKSLIRKSKNKSTSSYKLNPLAVLIPVGTTQGVVQMPFGVTTWNPLVNLKQKDLFVTKTFKGFGTEPDAFC